MNWHRVVRLSTVIVALAATVYLWSQFLRLYYAEGGDVAISVGFGVVLPLALLLLVLAAYTTYLSLTGQTDQG